MNPRKPMNPFSLWAEIMNATEGRFFTVEFIKKDGTLRRLNGRIFEKIDPAAGHVHIVVKDVHVARKGNKKGYRKIDPKTIRAFKSGGFKIGRFSYE